MTLTLEELRSLRVILSGYWARANAKNPYGEDAFKLWARVEIEIEAREKRLVKE